MSTFDEFLETFMSGDYFLIFLILMMIILLVLVLALIKTRLQYTEMLECESKTLEKEEKDIIDDIKSSISHPVNNNIEQSPIIKQVDTSSIKTYDNIIDDYESSEEENAVISASDLEREKQKRMDELGISNSQSMIQKYEEEQEKKAIISYEQLLKNASNITLTYKNESKPIKDYPKINKVEINQKEIVQTDNYLQEEEFLKVLKEFRLTI